jgi:hypothetical protein
MSSTKLAPARERSGYRPMLKPFDHFRRVIILCALVIFVLLVAARIIAGSASWVAFELPFDQFLSNGHSAGLDAVSLSIAWLLSPIQGLIIVVLVSSAVLWRSRGNDAPRNGQSSSAFSESSSSHGRASTSVHTIPRMSSDRSSTRPPP